MGTNYYAHIIPTRKRREELSELILNSENYNNIIEEVNNTFGPFSIDYSGNKKGNIVHLGKCSGGWKFLWNPNIYIIRNVHAEKTSDNSYIWINDPNTYDSLYSLTKDGIKAFIDRDDVEIYDEYGEKQDKEEFFKTALDWTTWKDEPALDGDSYYKKYPNEYHYKCSGEYVDLLESLGYKLGITKSDFYSDGLRFSTSNDFC